MRRILTICFLICVLGVGSRAQYDKYRVLRLDISPGPVYNEVTSIFKDQRGFIWLGTMSGLNRWDGYGFKIFRHDLQDPSSLDDDFIVQILEGPGQKLWVSTREGFNVYNPLTEKFDRDVRS